MAAFTGNSKFGLFKNGQAQEATDNYFEAYNYTSADSLSGDGCFAVDYNVYGSGMQGSEYIPVDPENESYILSVAVKTYQRNYLNNLGSGHLGFGCYDANKNFISHYHAFSTSNTTLSRAANPGDTTIYITNADSGMVSGMNSASSHFRSLNFYFAGSPYPTVGGYSRYNMYAKVVRNSITQTAQGDWEITFTTGLPNWGYSFAVGTNVGRTYAGGSYNYALGAPTYPETWTTYTTGVMSGYVLNTASSGATFRDQTKFIKFLNLRNYNYRTQNAGDSARYYVDNIFLHKIKPPTPAQIAQGATHNTDFNSSALRQKISSVTKFKKPRRGGQKRSDFFP